MASISASPAAGPVPHRHRGRAVELDHRRRLGPQQHVVQSDDLRPVGLGGARRLGVHRGDRRLERVGAEASRRRAPAPPAPRPPRSAPGSTRARSCSSSSTSSPSAVVRAAAATRAAASAPAARPPRAPAAARPAAGPAGSPPPTGRARVSESPDGRRVAFVEHQIDHVQHAVEPLGQVGARRAPDRECARRESSPWPARSAAPPWAAASQERARDLLGGEAADLAQRERDLRVGRQRRMAAGEDQPQPVVLDAVVVRLGSAARRRRLELLGQRGRARRRTGPAGAARRSP